MSRTGKIVLSAIILAAVAYYVPAALPVVAIVILVLLMNALGR